MKKTNKNSSLLSSKGKKIERILNAAQGLGQSVDQGVSQTISLAQGVGRGISNAFTNLFAGGDSGKGQSPASVGLKAPSKATPAKSAALYFKGGNSYFLLTVELIRPL